MSELTTERLEKLQDDLLQFQDSYSDPADKENYDIFVDALHVLDEFKAAKEKLLAYEQAADRPVGEIFRCSGNKTLRWWNDVPERTVLYAAPVLHKQPESRNEIMAKGVESFAKDWKGSASYSLISEVAYNFSAKLRNGDADEC